MIAATLLIIVSSWLALWLLGVTDSNQVAGRLPHPEVVLLTDQPGTSAEYKVEYFAFSRTRAGQSTFGPPADDLPFGARKITLSFHGQVPEANLSWVLLLNSDAAMSNAIADTARGAVQETDPGASFTSSCQSLDDFATTQVLSGQQTLDQDGFASAAIVGGVNPEIEYPTEDNRTAVDVISFRPSAPLSAAGTECTLDLQMWDQVGGRLWRTPTLTDGWVNVGRVSSGSFVESANPPNRDPRTLQWQLQGPADVSYTLFSNDGQHQRERRLFYAGATAGFAAALFVEVLKTILEMAQVRSRRGDQGDSRPSTPAPETMRGPQEAPEAPKASAHRMNAVSPRTTQPGRQGVVCLVAVALAAASGFAVSRLARRRGGPP